MRDGRINWTLLFVMLAGGCVGAWLPNVVIWIAGWLPFDTAHVQSVIFSWLFSESLILLAYSVIVLIRLQQAKIHHFDRHEIDENDPVIIELRRRARVPAPPWHGEDGA